MPRLTQWLAVARCGKPAPTRPQVLVRVEVDRAAGGRRLREHDLDVPGRVRVDVRRAPGDVGAHRERLAQEHPVRGAGNAGERVGERDDLDVHELPQLVAHAEERLDRAQLDPLPDVDVRPDRRRPVREEHARGPARPLGDVLDAQRLAVRVPSPDRREELGELAAEAVGGERLVEVRVRLGERGHEQVAVELEHLLPVSRHELTDLLDETVAEPHVGASAVGERRVCEQHPFLLGRAPGGGGLPRPRPVERRYLVTYGTLSLPARIIAATCFSFARVAAGIFVTAYFGLSTSLNDARPRL